MKKQMTPLLVTGAIVLFILVIFGSQMFVTIQPGERGVIFRKFTTGLDLENIYDPGFKIIAPWNDMNIYNVKEQQSEEQMDILDKNGLSIKMDVSVRFNPSYNMIGYLHQSFGVGYISQLVIPEVRSSVRQVAGRFSAEEIYSTKRAEVESAIITETEKVLSKNNIVMQALLIRSIILPAQIKNAIEEKLKQEQEALAYVYILDKALAEAERQRIAAEGEAAANRIINNSLTPNLLRMRGIETTLKLAESPNSKVIIIGSGKDGLPLILGGSN